MASADEIRRLLDDPHVANGTKKQLLRDLAAMTESNDDELRRYARDLGMSEEEMTDLHDAVELVDETIDLDPHDEHIRQAHIDQDLGQSWANLTDSTSSPTSDAILDDGIVGLKIFDEFYPRFTRVGGSAGGEQPVDPDGLRRAVDELRGIDFRAFATDASSVNEVVSGVDDSRNHLAQAWSTNLSGWTGPAAESANQYKAKFDGAIATLDAGIKPVPGALTSASETIQKQVTDYAKHLHNQWGDGRMAQLTPAELDAVIEGKERLPEVISDLENFSGNLLSLITGALGYLAGGPLGAIAAVAGLEFATSLSPFNLEEELEKYRQALRTCEEKINQFKQDYTSKASAVHQYTDNACQAVQETYDALFAATTGTMSANPFEALGTTPDFEDAQQGGTGERPRGGGPGPGGGGPPGPGGGGPGPGGGGPGPGGGGPGPGGGGPVDPDAATPLPAETGPEQPTDPSRMPVPAGPGAGGAPETISIKDGDRTISVTSPDGQGHVKVTVDDGTGQPKSYDLDFGAPTGTGSAGGPGTPAVDPATGRPIPGVGDGGGPGSGGGFGPGGPGGSATPGLPVVDPATARPLPAVDPATGQPVPGGVDTPVTAGPDGRCVITDGPLTITAEHPPGSPDTIRVTIDDGTGEPTSYTLDYSGSTDQATGRPGESAPVRTLPYEAGQPDRFVAAGEPQVAASVPAGAMPAGPPDLPPPPVVADEGYQATAAAASGSHDPVGGQYAGGEFGSAPDGQAGSVGLPDTGTDHPAAGGPGEAGLSAAAEESGGGNAPAGAVGGGMPMMGGMGGAAPGGGDQDRSTGPWRTAGDLFDEDYTDAEAALGRVTSDEGRFRR
ncbi:MAG TPA: hypothetical protein VFV67_15995 [Actinophytocola sp.]|uniref:hypothetical protein n=1 Tax=Actinophytocola sp. TaxID=1872138 RepID=UPI002DBC3702|nr:hypothetical protein [Actinophytocola sp.]HEU5472155.1 hypothetical protein [Actinophytocola sp.]